MPSRACIKFRTLRVVKGVGDGFIMPRISTADAYQLGLQPGVVPTSQAQGNC